MMSWNFHIPIRRITLRQSHLVPLKVKRFERALRVLFGDLVVIRVFFSGVSFYFSVVFG